MPVKCLSISKRRDLSAMAQGMPQFSQGKMIIKHQFCPFLIQEEIKEKLTLSGELNKRGMTNVEERNIFSALEKELICFDNAHLPVSKLNN